MQYKDDRDDSAVFPVRIVPVDVRAPFESRHYETRLMGTIGCTDGTGISWDNSIAISCNKWTEDMIK